MMTSASGSSCRTTSILTECALKSNDTCLQLSPARQRDGPPVVTCQ